MSITLGYHYAFSARNKSGFIYYCKVHDVVVNNVTWKRLYFSKIDIVWIRIKEETCGVMKCIRCLLLFWGTTSNGGSIILATTSLPSRRTTKTVSCRNSKIQCNACYYASCYYYVDTIIVNRHIYNIMCIHALKSFLKYVCTLRESVAKCCQNFQPVFLTCYKYRKTSRFNNL